MLVERRYFFDVICRRVEEHPDPRLVNGHQDIERALNRRWWRHRRDPMGHAAEGVLPIAVSTGNFQRERARGRPDQIDLERGESGCQPLTSL